MSKLETILATQAYRDRCGDRVAVFSDDERTVIIVCDDAEGVGSGWDHTRAISSPSPESSHYPFSDPPAKS